MPKIVHKFYSENSDQNDCLLLLKTNDEHLGIVFQNDDYLSPILEYGIDDLLFTLPRLSTETVNNFEHRTVYNSMIYTSFYKDTDKLFIVYEDTYRIEFQYSYTDFKMIFNYFISKFVS
jgi:hypothetical protein